MNRIEVPDEFSPLREVFVGIFDPDAPIAPVSYSLRHYLSPDAIEMTRDSVGRSFRDIDPPGRITATERQLDDLAALYRAHGVVVHRPRRLTGPETEFVVPGGDPMFARDPVVVIGNRVIELSLMMPSRRKEIFAYRDGLRARIADDPAVAYFATPGPAPSTLDPAEPEGTGPFLEGGDVFVLGKDVLVGNSGIASNRDGIAWLAHLLRPEGYRVHEVRLARHWLHLDCVLAVIRPGLALCHRPAFPDGLPALLAGWDIVEATEAEAHAMGCNTVCLAPNKVVVAREHTRLIDRLREHGVDVVADLHFGLVSEFGGGIRCATMPLSRAE